MTSTASAAPSAATRFDLGRWTGPLACSSPSWSRTCVIALGAGDEAQTQFINALTIGAIYALIALGYTMVYGIIELINFAHGDVFMCGSFVSWWLLTVPWGSRAPIDRPRGARSAALVVTFIVSMVAMGVVGVVIERFAYRPLRDAPRLAPLITAIGVSFILQNIVFVTISNSIVTTPQLIPSRIVNVRTAARSTRDQPVRHRAGPAPHGGPAAVRQPHAPGTGDALHRDRPRGGPADGRRHQHHHRPDLLHRFGPGGRGRRRPGPLLRCDRVQPRLPGRPEGVHGRGPGRHRQHHRRGPRRLRHRLHRGHRRRLGYGRWSEAAVFAVLVLVLVFRPTGILGQQLADRA